MKLSVIIPVYNAEPYLKKCLDSVLTQEYKNIEVILVNDGSEDNSENIIKEYQSKYSNIIYIRQENHGQASARNNGLTHAKGDLISFIDSDDYILPNMFSTMINKLQNDNSDLVMCNISLEKSGRRTEENCIDHKNLYECPASVCNKIFKKELIDNLRFIEGIWYEDYNFFIKVCLKKPKFSTINNSYYIYRINDSSTMHNDNALKNLDIITATNDILELSIPKEMKETLIINHILVDAINRVNNQKSKDKKYVIKELTNYVRKNVKNLKETTNYQKSNIKRKIIMFLNYHELSNISHFLLKIKGRKNK